MIGMINPNGSKNVELIFSILRLVTGKLTAVEKISEKLEMNLYMLCHNLSQALLSNYS